jgi:NAD(P)-dependent dehydrogenase (short-subunit alcohol dehydrogenase family)
MLQCFDLTGKTAFITGASGGLGEVFSKALAKAGASLYVVARGEAGLKKICGEIHEMNTECYHHTCDISDDESIEKAVAACIKQYGKVDILVNNAAAHRNNLSPMETNTQSYKDVLLPNVIGGFRLLVHVPGT